MIRNFLIIALRGLKKNPLYSTINIFSLGISISVGLLVLMMLAEQNNYDDFHPEKDRIFRILSGRSYAYNQNATVPMPIADALHNYDSELEIVQLSRSVGGDVVYDAKSIQLAGYYANPEFFKVFGFQLKSGNPALALNEPKNVVITEEAAHSLFGTEDPIGKVVTISERGLKPSGFDSKLEQPLQLGDFRVTGIIKAPPNKSHLQFDMLVSSKAMYSLHTQGIKPFPFDDWDNYFTSYTYIKVPQGYNINLLVGYLEQLTESHYTHSEFYKLHFELQPLSDITPGKLLNYAPSLRMPRALYIIFGILVLFIVLIASFNYTNITVARSMIRAREVGIRKVSGATKKQLLVQFLVESITLSGVSAMFAFFVLLLIKPAFMGLHINTYLNYDLSENGYFLIYALFFILSIGLISGLFPSYFLSGMKPSVILKSTLLLRPQHVPFLKKVSLYKASVFAQFFFSVIFIVSTLLIVKQSRHYFQMETGFNKDNILILDMQGYSFMDLKSRFSSIVSVTDIDASDIIPGAGFNELSYSVSLEDQNEYGRNFQAISISKDFISTYEIDLLAGSGFSDIQGESSVLINMHGVKVLGFDKPEEVLDLTLKLDEGKEFVKIIGVTDNFQSCMPLAQNEQLMLRCLPEKYQYLSMKFNQPIDHATKETIRSLWKDLDAVHEANFDLLTNEIDESVSVFKDISNIIGFITAVSIFISCFGLLGITAFVTERRVKEIGIRKVFGANLFQLHGLLSGSFLKLILISAIAAAPFAFIFNGFWLNRLANKVSFGLDTMLFGIVIILLLAIVTISIQVLRMSLINPINVLREE